MKLLSIFSFSVVLFLVMMNSFPLDAQDDKNIIILKEILQRQNECWNKGDIDCFMIGYWQSEKLKFIGKNGVTYGWKQTLDRYKKSYPDKQTMGQLEFDLVSIDKLYRKSYLMIGKWKLNRDGLENLEGHFSLTWKKIKGEWLIIADHSS